MDYEGIKALLECTGGQFLRLKHLWLDAGYRGENKGKDWVEKALGWSVELVERPRKNLPPRGGADEVGGGISQGRQEGGLVQALTTPGISGLAAPLGSGTLLCLDRP